MAVGEEEYPAPEGGWAGEKCEGVGNLLWSNYPELHLSRTTLQCAIDCHLINLVQHTRFVSYLFKRGYI
eukprot:1176997-Prorocentrum_minimum.AAC.3